MRGQVTYIRHITYTRNTLIYMIVLKTADFKCTLFRLTWIYSELFRYFLLYSDIFTIFQIVRFTHAVGRLACKLVMIFPHKINLNPNKSRDKFSLTK